MGRKTGRASDVASLGKKSLGTDQFDLMKVLPKDLEHFYAYGGSLTTPPCTEGVQWIVLKEPIELSKAQIGRFMQGLWAHRKTRSTSSSPRD